MLEEQSQLGIYRDCLCVPHLFFIISVGLIDRITKILIGFRFYLVWFSHIVYLLADEQVVYMAIVGSFPFNSFLSGVLSCIGTAVLAGKQDIYFNIFVRSDLSKIK